MIKLNCVIDTSAALSLFSTGKFKLATKFFSFFSPGKVKDELIEMSKTSDKIGNIANNILKSSLIKIINLAKEFQNNRGEIEVINLANKLKADLILMDDIQATKKLQRQCNIKIRFSPFVIFVLCEKNIITYKDGLSAIEEMKTKREWQENLIIEYAQMLLENLMEENKL